MTADFFIHRYAGVPDEKKLQLVMREKPANDKITWSSLGSQRVVVKVVSFWNDTKSETGRESYEVEVSGDELIRTYRDGSKGVQKRKIE